MNLKNLFKRQSTGTPLPKKADVFAVLTGDYAGEMLIYIKGDKKVVNFLSIPNMINRDIPYDKFEFAVKNDIIELTYEKLPKNVYALCVEQYKHNSKANK